MKICQTREKMRARKKRKNIKARNARKKIYARKAHKNMKTPTTPGVQPEIFLGRGGFVKLGDFDEHFYQKVKKKGPS